MHYLGQLSIRSIINGVGRHWILCFSLHSLCAILRSRRDLVRQIGSRGTKTSSHLGVWDNRLAFALVQWCGLSGNTLSTFGPGSPRDLIPLVGMFPLLISAKHRNSDCELGRVLGRLYMSQLALFVSYFVTCNAAVPLNIYNPHRAYCAFSALPRTHV